VVLSRDQGGLREKSKREKSMIVRMLLVKNEHLTETTQSSVFVTVETRKGFGRETDTTREIETHGDTVTQRAQQIETGFVGGTEK